MKKYLLCMVMCLVFSFVLAGCSDNEEASKNDATTEAQDAGSTEETTEDAGLPDEFKEEMNLEEVFQKGMDSYAEKNIEAPILFPETDMEYLENFYPGLSYANIKQMYIAMAPVTNAPMEVAMIEVGDGTDIPMIRDIFTERIQERSNDTGYPEESAVWKNNAKVTIRGNFVFMAVMPDHYGIPEEFILE